MDAMEGEAASSSMQETYRSEDEMENLNTSKNVYNEIEIASSDEDDEELVFSRGSKRKKEYLIDSDEEEGEDLEVKISADEETNFETLEKDEFGKESDIAYNKDSTHMSEEFDIEDLIYDDVVHEEDAKEEVKNEEQVQAFPKKKIAKSRRRLKKCSTKIASKGMNGVVDKGKNLREPLNKNLQIMNDLDVLEKDDENNRMCSEEQIEDTSEKKIGRRRWGGKGSKKKIAVKRTEEVIEEPKDKENGDGGVVHEEDDKEGMKDENQVEENYEKKINKSKIGVGKGLKKNIVLWDVNEVIVKDVNDPESSNRTTPKKAKIMGMIFMCSAKTKKDCYRYKILGLPSNKRDEVLNISKGMKLFLFDVDSKLLHGIYKAAGPGGYNIEPKAFKSAFPSQVRFNVFQDCVPVPEEKFKKVIKDNYFKKNKFHSQLTLKQVKSLCKLFKPAPKPERLWRNPEPHTQNAPPSEPRRSRKDVRPTIYKDKDKRRKRNSRVETRGLANRNRNHALVNRDPSRKRLSPETRGFAHQERSRKRHRDAYDRNGYSSPPPRAILPRELSPGSFTYEGYRRDSSLVDHHHDRRFRDLELRHHEDRVRDSSFQEHRDRWYLDSRLRPHREEIEYREPYPVYRERPSYHDRSYLEAQPSEYLGPLRTARYDDVSRPRVGLYDSYIGVRSWY